MTRVCKAREDLRREAGEKGCQDGLHEGQILGTGKACKTLGMNFNKPVSCLTENIPNLSQEDARAQARALW